MQGTIQGILNAANITVQGRATQSKMPSMQQQSNISTALDT